MVMIQDILDPTRAVINSQMNGRNELFWSIVIKDKVWLQNQQVKIRNNRNSHLKGCWGSTCLPQRPFGNMHPDGLFERISFGYGFITPLEGSSPSLFDQQAMWISIVYPVHKPKNLRLFHWITSFKIVSIV
jgi:hypothetical protein